LRHVSSIAAVTWTMQHTFAWQMVWQLLLAFGASSPQLRVFVPCPHPTQESLQQASWRPLVELLPPQERHVCLCYLDIPVLKRPVSQSLSLLALLRMLAVNVHHQTAGSVMWQNWTRHGQKNPGTAWHAYCVSSSSCELYPKLCKLLCFSLSLCF